MFANLFWMNPILGAFNLLPAFPMDGGRIFRSILARRMDYVRATRISVFLGYIFAILFALLALVWKHMLLLLVAAFVYISATREKNQVLREDALAKRMKSDETAS
jgi:Zn-dependent protease